jgi:hypothetical protein
MQRRERDMEKEADPGGLVPVADEFGDVDELVVLNPDEVPLPAVAEDAVGELLVDLQVGVPERGVEIALSQQVVEEGPEDAVGEPLVEILDLLFREEDGQEVVPPFLVTRVEHGLPGAPPLERHPRPADPETAAVGEHRSQRAHQAAGPGLQTPAVALFFEHDRKAVGDDEQALCGGAQSRLEVVQGVSQTKGRPPAGRDLFSLGCQPQVGGHPVLQTPEGGGI